jgi:hypothetical protein
MGESGNVLSIEEAISSAEALVKVFKALETLPDEESRARVMAIVATKFGFYDQAVAFLRAAVVARAAATAAPENA